LIQYNNTIEKKFDRIQFTNVIIYKYKNECLSACLYLNTLCITNGWNDFDAIFRVSLGGSLDDLDSQLDSAV